MNCKLAIFEDVPDRVVSINGTASRTRSPVECGGTIQMYYLEELHMGYICDKCFSISNPDAGMDVAP